MLCCAAGRGAAARVPGGRTTLPAVSVPRLRTPRFASGTSERARALVPTDVERADILTKALSMGDNRFKVFRNEIMNLNLTA